MSHFSKSGCSSRSQLWVGTPTKLVTRSRSISSRARPASHLCIITSFSPATSEPKKTGHVAGDVEERDDQDEDGGAGAAGGFVGPAQRVDRALGSRSP